MDEINYRLITSFLFFTNIFYCYYNKYFIYSFLFCNLLISSVVLHWMQFDLLYLEYEINLMKKIDKFNILLIILYGSYVYFRKLLTKKNNFIISALVVYFLIICIFLWNYGFIKKKYCFDIDKNKSCKYHSLLHISGCLGHLLIVFM